MVKTLPGIPKHNIACNSYNNCKLTWKVLTLGAILLIIQTSTQNLSLHRDYNCTSGLGDIHSLFLEGFMIYPNQNLQFGYFPPRDKKNCCFGFVVGMVELDSHIWIRQQGKKYSYEIGKPC